MTISRTAYPTKDTWLAHAVGGSTNYGNGSTSRITVGPAVSSSSTYKGRGLFSFPLNFAGIEELTAATITFTVADQDCATRGGTYRLLLEPLLADFTENSASGPCVVATSGANSAKWPGPGVTTEDSSFYTGSGLTTGSTIAFDVLDMLTAAFAAGATVLRVRLIAANTGGTGYAETTAARTITVYSRKANTSTNRPVLAYDGDETVSTNKAMDLSIGVVLSMSVATPSAFTVNGAEGRIVVSQPDSSNYAILDGVSEQDVDVGVQYALDLVPAGGFSRLGLLARALDDDNFYQLSMRVHESRLIDAVLYKMVAGVLTSLASVTIGNFVAGVVYHLQLQAVGISPTLLYGRIWREGSAIPDWQVTASDSAAALQADGSVGISVSVTSVTNLPLTFLLDEFTAVAP